MLVQRNACHEKTQKTSNVITNFIHVKQLQHTYKSFLLCRKALTTILSLDEEN